MATVKLEIKKQCFFNNGELLLPALTDKSGKPLKQLITDCLCQDYSLNDKKHTEKQKKSWMGYSANDINKELRNKMSCIAGIHGETHVEYHSLLHGGIKGFDFALYDEDYNYVQLRNTCIGNPGMYNGDTILKEMYHQFRQNDSDGTKMTQAEWLNILSHIGGTPGENVEAHKNFLTIVGELQFGNWALAKNDVLRLATSSIKNSIDYYIYITSTGSLESKFSSGIVTYDKIVKSVNENIHLLPIPMWIIALDISK